MSIDLTRLRAFHAVAREKNISRAAKVLDMAQSTLSRNIAEFEEEMKAPLITRASRGISLTAQGERVYEFAKKILQESDLFEKSFHEKSDEIEGELIIATTPSVGVDWLVPRMDDFLENNPKLKVKILLRMENINLSDSDVIIRTFIPDHPNLVQILLFTVRMKLFASEKYLKKFGVPLTLQDLDCHRLISENEHISSLGNVTWFLRAGLSENQSMRESYLEINSLAGSFQCALQGWGVVTLPDVSPFINSNLIEVLPDIKGPEIPIYYTFLEARLSSKKITQLASYLTNWKI